jgi:hypothetical protein
MRLMTWRAMSARPSGAVPEGGGDDQEPGRPVQVDPIKPTLKAPGTKRLKLEHRNPLSTFAFKCNLHRYKQGKMSCLIINDIDAGRGLHSSTFRLNISAFCGIGVHEGVV